MIHTIDKLYNTTSVSIVNTYGLELLIESCESLLNEFDQTEEQDPRVEFWGEEIREAIESLKDNKYT
jgi:hypothetical protein